MSAISQDTLPEKSGEVLHFDTSALPRALPGAIDVSDPTEDLANDVTSELTPVRLSTRAQMQPDAACGSVLRERYVLEQQLGNGGTAMIFRANDLRRDVAAAEGPRVAIKLLRPELRDRPQNIARLQREFRQTQALSHPGIVRFHDLDCDRGTWFIVMELLDGETLGPLLRRAAPRPITMDETIRIAAATAEALAFAHERGVSHGDVKPDNIFVTTTGAVRVLDFGVAPESLAHAPAENRPAPNRRMAAATRAYSSPQVLAGECPEPRDDVFSLACVIYEMLAGRHPYGRRGADVARDSRLTIEALSSLTEAQWAVLVSGLAWSRELRPSIRDLMAALRAAAPMPVTVPVPAPAPVVPAEPSRRRTGKWRLAAAVGFAFVIGVAISRFDRESPVSAAVDAPAKAPRDAAAAPRSGIPATTPAKAAAPMESSAPTADASPVPQPEVAPPTPPGLVAFDASSMVVSSRAVVAAIPVRHFTRERRSVAVRWRAIDGSAVAGRDYGGPQSGVANFTDGHTFRIIYVPITVAPQAAGDRAFTIELTDASPGASLGIMSRIVVTIQDDV
ncbi:MAG: protein kinase domain-containing protein [Steroidobacteraceae bacterium]